LKNIMSYYLVDRLFAVGLGGWVITFMIRVRKASAYASGISGSGFWAGMVVGRAGLGFVTERYGERLCVSIYIAVCIVLQLLFWLVPRFEVSAVAVAFLGFFLGPLFPGAVMVTAKLLPKNIHVSAIGFAMAMGGTGGTVFPFAVGAIASSRGIAVMQPIMLVLVIAVAVLWLSFPRIKKRE
jgi:fucose permease